MFLYVYWDLWLCVVRPGTVQTEIYETHGERNAQRMVHIVIWSCSVINMKCEEKKDYSLWTTFIILVQTATCFGYTSVAIIRLDIGSWIQKYNTIKNDKYDLCHQFSVSEQGLCNQWNQIQETCASAILTWMLCKLIL